MSANLHLPAGSAAEGPWTTAVTPALAEWSWTGLRVAQLEAGGAVSLSTGPMRSWCCRWPGRARSRARQPTARLRRAVAGPGRCLCRADRFRLRAQGQRRHASPVTREAGSRFRRPRARRPLPPRRAAAEDAAVETARRRAVLAAHPQLLHAGHLRRRPADRLRGGHAGRQLVLVPAAQARRGERGESPCSRRSTTSRSADGPSGPGMAYQRVYGTPDRPIDLLAEVHSGDVVLIPHGWHGPSIAAPGYDLYYLNVMAGPGERAWRICDDPAHAWIRTTWPDQPVDPRAGAAAVGGRIAARRGEAAMTEAEVNGTRRLTVAQALVRFLSVQFSERDGVEHRLIEGCFGIFGHGNLAGIGQALLESELAEPGVFPYRQSRNEQAMVHAAAAFARMRDRLSTLACTTSIGPGATNLVTGAALATINRLPVLLLPGDYLRHPRRQSRAARARISAEPRCLGQRHAAAGVAVLRPDQPARAAARRAAGRDAGAHRPGRDRARSRSRCRRTCRPRPSTGRPSCSSGGSGTCRVHVRTCRRWRARSG